MGKKFIALFAFISFAFTMFTAFTGVNASPGEQIGKTKGNKCYLSKDATIVAGIGTSPTGPRKSGKKGG